MDVTLPSGTPAMAELVANSPRGLVIIPDIWGLRGLYADMAANLSAQTGWSVVAIEPFPGQRLGGAADPAGFEQRSTALRAIDDTRLLGDALAAAELTGSERIGVIGFCMGGMYALKASAVDRFDAVVGFYGMIRVPEDWAGPGQGQPLDAIRHRGDTSVMAIVGTIDAWTPPDDVDALAEAGATVVRYEGADHGFVHDPTRPAHRPDDAADAWGRALEFLDR